MGEGFSGGTSPLLYVLFGNSPDPEDFTKCDVVNDETALCKVPPFFNASGVEEHRGAPVEIMVSLAEEDARVACRRNSNDDHTKLTVVKVKG